MDIYELRDEGGNRIILFIHCEVPRVEQTDLGIRQIAPEGGGSHARRIVATPHEECWRLMLRQPRLPHRIRHDIRPVVIQPRALNVPLSWPRQMRVFVGPRVGVVTLGVRGTRDTALFGHSQLHERIEDVLMR